MTSACGTPEMRLRETSTTCGWLTAYVRQKAMAIWILTLGVLLYTTPQSDAFTVEPGADLFRIAGQNARFFFGLDPWPTPCPPCPPDYHTVVIEFRNVSGRSTLCEVTYHNSTYDDVTSLPCSEQSGRMQDFDPVSAIDGVTFEILNVSYVDRGEYELVVTYKGGSETNRNSSMLTVFVPPGPPEILGNAATHEGDPVNLTCRVTGSYPGASLRWTRGSYSELAPSYYREAAAYEEYSVSELRFSAHYTDHGVSYVCSAENTVSWTPATSSVALTVTHGARAELLPCTDQSPVHYTTEGENVHFTCQVDAFPAASNIQWYKYSSDSPSNAQPIPELANSTEMVMKNVSRDSEAFYWCSAQNDYGSSGKVKCQIEIQYGPKIENLPVSEELALGESLDVTCSASGNPPVTSYVWRKTTNDSFVVDDERLVVSDVTIDDAGQYTCTATNYLRTGSYEKPYSDMASFELFVLHSPQWTSYALTKFSSTVSHPATLVCDVTAYPEVTFTWQFGGDDVTPGVGINITNGPLTSHLQIASVEEGDRGDYQCTARNDVGTAHFVLELLPPGVPDPPQACVAEGQADTEVTLRCMPGYDGGDVMTYYVETRYAGGEAKPASHVTQAANATLVVIRVVELSPDTEYTATVYAENSYGRSEKAAEVEFRTTGVSVPDDPPEISPETAINIGAIVGGTVGGVVFVVLVALLGLYIYWKHEPEDDQSDADDTTLGRSPFPYTVIADDEYGEDTRRRYEKRYTDPGVNNPSYDPEEGRPGLRRQSVVENDYIPHPGLRRMADDTPGCRAADGSRDPLKVVADVHVSGAAERLDRHRRAADEAYTQRKAQSNLAGMGALSHGSRQNINAIQHSPVNYVTPQRDAWEISPDELRFGHKLGDGAFGEVWKASLMGRKIASQSPYVAVKMVKAGCPQEERQALYKEMEVMKMLRPHPNVIRLIGCCTEHEPVFIVMEFASSGSLQQFLRENRASIEGDNGQYQVISTSLTSRDLVTFAYQTACGMEYISLNKLLHRDLAARNVLIDDKITCKIADFGFARDVINCREYESKSKRRLPIRWMAPESLFDNIYSTKSDVWAFGVLLWEIVTFGSSPYPGMSGSDVMEVIQLGYRMDKPKHCSNEIYALMRQCWKQSANQRPSFTELREDLEMLLINMSRDQRHDLDISQMQENMFDILRNLPGEKC